MVRDLAALARSVGGVLVGDRIPPTALVDEAMRIEDATVVGHPRYVTLIVSPADRLRDELAGPRATVLAAGVPVTTGDPDSFRDLARSRDATLLVVPEIPLDVLHARLAANLAADQAADDRLVTLGMKVLTQVARSGGAPAVIAELAGRLDGWAVLLDSHGQPITSAGAGALHLRDATAVAFRRPVRVRHPGLEVFPVGAGEDLSAYLVISSRTGSTSRTRDLASLAAALLDLILRTHDSSTTERLGREALFASLLGRPAESAGALLRRWGVREESLTALVVSARTKSVEVERLVTRWFDDLGWPHVLTVEQGRVLALLRSDRVDDLADRITAFAAAAAVPLRCGVGAPATVDALARTVAEARQAFEVAIAEGATVLRYAELPTVRYVLDRLDRDEGSRVADLLEPLRDEGGQHAVLTRTLQVFLSEHGSWGVSARRLGVHRQTLAARMRRIEELTGLSMTSPDDRAAAWLALRALERASA